MSSRRQKCRARRVQPFHFPFSQNSHDLSVFRSISTKKFELETFFTENFNERWFSLTRTIGIIFEAWFFTRGKAKIENRNKRIMTSGESRFKLIKTFYS